MAQQELISIATYVLDFAHPLLVGFTDDLSFIPSRSYISYCVVKMV
ncbi:hypothetical protein VRK_42260 [Vibrio sp. MEBiC08052]|nr:hypothetical protein VRK_42260 [Vibrio sp. MEBiC08052]